MWITKSQRDFLFAQIYLILPLPPSLPLSFRKVKHFEFLLTCFFDRDWIGSGAHAGYFVRFSIPIRRRHTGFGERQNGRQRCRNRETSFANKKRLGSHVDNTGIDQLLRRRCKRCRKCTYLFSFLSFFLFLSIFSHFRGNSVWDMRNGQSPDGACPIMAGPVCGCCHLLNSSLWRTYMCTNPHLPFAYIPIFRAPILTGCFSSVSLSLGSYWQ